MKKSKDHEWIIMAIAATLVAVFIIIGIGYIYLLSQFPERDPWPKRDAHERRESLILNEHDEVIVKGLVVENNLGCGKGPQHCHFLLRFDDQKVYVYYFYGREGSCLNTEPAQLSSQIEKGDEVEVFGKYYDPGGIYTCDSADYYIRKLQ